MDNLHFIPNNILTTLFKELSKYKNDYQQYLNYIYRNYTMHFFCISLNISMHMHGGYKLVSIMFSSNNTI